MFEFLIQHSSSVLLVAVLVLAAAACATHYKPHPGAINIADSGVVTGSNRGSRLSIPRKKPSVLARPKFSFGPDEIAAALAMFRDNGELVVPQTFARNLPDPDDAKFVDCAEAVQDVARALLRGGLRIDIARSVEAAGLQLCPRAC